MGDRTPSIPALGCPCDSPRVLTRGRSEVDRSFRCQGVGRVAGGVWGTWASAPSSKPITTAGGRIRPPNAVARRNERRLHCLRTQPEGPRLCRQGPDTSHRSLAMELRPLGLPPWCVDQQLQSPSPGRNGRYGARDDAQHPQPCGPGTIHGADPRAPLPRLGARATASRRAAPVRLQQCECGCVSGSGPSGPRSPRRRGSSSLEQKGPQSAPTAPHLRGGHGGES